MRFRLSGIRNASTMLVALALGACAPAVLAQYSPPSFPAGWKLYDPDGTTTTVTVGQTTTTPETISAQGDVDLDELPYVPEGVNTYFSDTSPATLAIAPVFPASIDLSGIAPDWFECLANGLGPMPTFANLIGDSLVAGASNSLNLFELTSTLAGQDDNLDIYAERQFTIPMYNYGEVYTPDPPAYVGWFWLHSSGELYNTCNVFDLDDESPESMPTYSEASAYYDAVALWKTKVKAIYHNMWLEINQGETHTTAWTEIEARAYERFDLARQDLFNDIYDAWLDEQFGS